MPVYALDREKQGILFSVIITIYCVLFITLVFMRKLKNPIFHSPHSSLISSASLLFNLQSFRSFHTIANK